MNQLSVMPIIISYVFFAVMGVLVGIQYVRHVKERINSEKHSYLWPCATLLSLVLLSLFIVKLGGFERNHWALDFLPLVIIVLSLFLTIKIGLKNKRHSHLETKARS